MPFTLARKAAGEQGLGAHFSVPPGGSLTMTGGSNAGGSHQPWVQVLNDWKPLRRQARQPLVQPCSLMIKEAI
jgi:hypothetical protein